MEEKICNHGDSKIEKFENSIEKEKIEECQRALEREKLASRFSKTDERQLRELQICQMKEKKLIEEQEKEIDMMWHEVLLADVNAKEQKEHHQAEQRQRDMMERRRAYDEQIASANRKRREMIQEQREQENRRLEKMRKKMERDYHEAVKRKKDQQATNKINFIEGHKQKVERIKSDKEREYLIDKQNIYTALEELRKERERKRLEMLSFKKQQEVLILHREKEKQYNNDLEAKSDEITQLWKKESEKISDGINLKLKEKNLASKNKAMQDYKNHLEDQNLKAKLKKQELSASMKAVQNTAFRELKIKMDNANKELDKQIEYRNSLIQQIHDNQRYMEQEMEDVKKKQEPFVRRAQMFKDVMNSKYPSSAARNSTNPVHPFRRVINQNETLQLPILGKSYSNNKAVPL